MRVARGCYWPSAFFDDWAVIQYCSTNLEMSISFELLPPFLKHHLATNIFYLLNKSAEERLRIGNVDALFRSYCQLLDLSTTNHTIDVQTFPTFDEATHLFSAHEKAEEALY
jgi:hypothetical protein